ncbi:glycoside hydrolase family 43 protein [Pelagicoccus enzymogenes]|uniref:glycoside hydrolase family 43 protein n=1 Tax=Pelagicoccus enzymogenes TaxID=2773457 RepID=UPI00280C74BC|nr:glycoside hydrolase family 43 protein [Pelagicoccus enzymogenes]MDQ8198034.1 glycoside hydrolase family 43 protein [Pelagicoccus enzymogenes]
MNNSYTNPVGDDLLMGDPFVLKAEGSYYLFGTTDPDRGFRCYQSENLRDWRELGFALESGPKDWGSAPFWAPEVITYQNRYYMTYSAQHGDTGRLLTAIAVSDRPQGPYRNWHAPWFDLGYSAIDSHIVCDTENKPFLLFSRNGAQDGYSYGKIYGAPLKADLSGLESEPVLLLEADQAWERIAWNSNRCNEGPFVIYEDGTYYMTYSANHTFRPGYGIGYATAAHPLGPWTKAEENPIAGTDLANGYSGAGHNSIVSSPDGSERFIVYHTHQDPADPNNEKRSVNIDRIFVESGRLRIEGPTRSPQALPSGS